MYVAIQHIYIYIYVYANFIKHNRHFMPTYFLLDPFEFPYYFYRIRGEIDLGIVQVLNSSAFKKTFMPNNTTTKKFSPTTQQYSNIKIINKNFRFSKHYILKTCNQHLIELIFKPVQTYLNVFSYWHYLQNYI